MRKLFAPILFASLLTTLGCVTMKHTPIDTVGQVNLPRFMGTWYVIGSIPTVFEKNAYNAVESYEQNPDHTIKTTFTYRKGGFDGPVKTMRPTGYVRASSNAVWGMQFLWPFKSEYLIAHVDANYTQTIIARSARDYVWIMARSPQISDADYQSLVERAGDLGYDVAKIHRVPQRWP